METLLETIRMTLAPWMPAADYRRRVQQYLSDMNGRVTPKSFGVRVIGPEEAERHGDNSAGYETMTYQYRGLEAVLGMIGEGKRVVFAGSHHGALLHNGFAVTRVIPTTVFFTRYTFQYGKIFSFPMAEQGALGLLKMRSLLHSGRHAWYYLDSAPTGITVKAQFLGQVGNWSIAPLRVLASIRDLEIVPVTTCYRPGEIVETIFHKPPISSAKLTGMPEVEVLNTLLADLERGLREEAPEQVRWEYLHRREWKAAAFEGRGPA